jgi:hypothetical protein
MAAELVAGTSQLDFRPFDADGGSGRFRHGVSIGKNTDFGVPRRIDIVGNCFDKTYEADSIAGAVDIGHFTTQFVPFVGNVVVAPQLVPALSLDGFDHLIAGNLLIGGGIQLGSRNDALASANSAIDAYSRISILSNKIRALPGSITPGIFLETSGNTVIGNDIDLTGSVAGKRRRRHRWGTTRRAHAR